jgi:hypothetical protein
VRGDFVSGFRKKNRNAEKERKGAPGREIKEKKGRKGEKKKRRRDKPAVQESDA